MMTAAELRQRRDANRLTDAEIELCATKTCADHPDWPADNSDRTAWISAMARTHKQLLCGECLLWKIWVPR